MSTEKYDSVMKIVLFGNTKAGKTSILNVLTEKPFDKDEKPTVGVEFFTHIVNTGIGRIKQQIWDTAGEERYSGIVRSYFRGAAACIFVIDETKLNEFKGQLKQLQAAKEIAPSNAKFYIAINKWGEDDVQLHDEQTARDSINTLFNKADITLTDDELANNIFFCSAKTGQNIPKLFNKAAEDFSKQQIELKKTGTEAEAETRRFSNFDIEYIGPESDVVAQNKSPIAKAVFAIRNWWATRPTHSKAWAVGNGLLILGGAALFGLAAFTVGSFLTFGILPSAFLGAAIIAAGAALVWNIGCKIYDTRAKAKWYSSYLTNPLIEETKHDSSESEESSFGEDPAPTNKLNPEATGSKPIFKQPPTSGTSVPQEQLKKDDTTLER